MSNSSLELLWSSNSSGRSLRSNVSRTKTHKNKFMSEHLLQNDCEQSDLAVLSSSEFFQNAQERHTPDVRWVKSQDMFGSTEHSEEGPEKSAPSSLSLQVLVSSNPSISSSASSLRVLASPDPASIENSRSAKKSSLRKTRSNQTDNVKETQSSTKLSQDNKRQSRRHQNSANLKNTQSSPKSSLDVQEECRRHQKFTNKELRRTLQRYEHSPDMFVSLVSPSAQTQRRTSTTQHRASTTQHQTSTAQHQTSTTQPQTSTTQQRTSPASDDTIRTIRSDSQLWDTQSLAEVSEELQVRSKQVKRLIRRLVKSKRLSDESLESLKKRFKTVC